MGSFLPGEYVPLRTPNRSQSFGFREDLNHPITLIVLLFRPWGPILMRDGGGGRVYSHLSITSTPLIISSLRVGLHYYRHFYLSPPSDTLGQCLVTYCATQVHSVFFNLYDFLTTTVIILFLYSVFSDKNVFKTILYENQPVRFLLQSVRRLPLSSLNSLPSLDLQISPPEMLFEHQPQYF